MIDINSLVNMAMKNSNIAQNPIAKNAIEMYQRGDIDGVNQLANNLCKERGIKQEDVINQIKNVFRM